jgi:hypothetical protein
MDHQVAMKILEPHGVLCEHGFLDGLSLKDEKKCMRVVPATFLKMLALGYDAPVEKDFDSDDSIVPNELLYRVVPKDWTVSQVLEGEMELPANCLEDPNLFRVIGPVRGISFQVSAAVSLINTSAIILAAKISPILPPEASTSSSRGWGPAGNSECWRQRTVPSGTMGAS